MSLNFNPRKVFIQISTYPPFRWLVASALILPPLGSLCGNTLISLSLFIAVCIFCLAVDAERLRGRIPGISVRLSPNFYAIRTLSGRRTVFQYKRDALTCREIKKSLVQDAGLVNTLAPGRYTAITHGPVLARIDKSPRMKITRCKKAYSSDMKNLLTGMTKGRCRKCEKKCEVWKAPKRQFYIVKFRVSA